MESTTDSLPPHLAERTRALNGGTPAGGRYVLYWMHHAMRVEENPALETALSIASGLGLPVLVYQGLGGRHRYNSDRHHYFILQGARDVARELSARGVRYLLHLPRRGDEASPLNTLCEAAGAIVVEEMPVPPFDRWHPALASRQHCPVWAVDTRCVFPMQQVGQAYDRAFRFREAVADEYAARVGAPWPADTPGSTGLAESPVPGFCGLAEQDDSELLDLIARCDIDHGVWPVFHTPGGSDAAAARWQSFLEQGLGAYHRLRNDAAVEPPRGVSRLSPYLHYGQISPFRVAREAAARGGKGAEKFLDELLVWRELAHNFCFYHRDLESLDILPGWARKTLLAHRDDPRPELRTHESLARACTGDALWDAAQRSLLRHGELHNNLRMTWAKAILPWTRGPEEALATLIDLNHRYALDGNDPNSYGGLLWALGVFDRPFKPEKPIIGTVRPRSTASHARRLDLTAYAERIDRPSSARSLQVAVVGAGVAGLAAARSLADAGHEVIVFEKSRGPGGRTATRRREDGRFDHGAQYFTARDPAFRRHLDSWLAAGIAEPWTADMVSIDGDGRRKRRTGGERYTGVPGMNALAGHLAESLAVQYRNRVGGFARVDDGWWLSLTGTDDGDGTPAGPFDAVVLALPAPQAAELLEPVAGALARRAAGVGFAPCLAVAARQAAEDAQPFDAAFIDDDILAWAAADFRKPGRDGARFWVLHADARWSADHLAAAEDAVIETLIERFHTLGGPALQADDAVFHRWRYARVDGSLDAGALFDRTEGIAVCGDWCRGESRVENAWLSGIAAAAHIIGMAGLSHDGAR